MFKEVTMTKSKVPRKERPSEAEGVIRMMRDRAQELLSQSFNEDDVRERLARGIKCVDAGSNPCIACGSEIPPDERFRADPLTEICSEACLPRAKELAAFRESLLKRIAELSAENRELQKSIRGASVEQGRAKEDNVGTLAIDDTTAAQADKLLAEKELCEDLIAHINKGAYGICEECDENIPTARLKVRPLTKFCVICQEKKEKEENRKKKR